MPDQEEEANETSQSEKALQSQALVLIGISSHPAGQKGNRRLLERVDNLFALVIHEPGDALLVLSLRNKQELMGNVKTEIGLYNSPKVAELGVLREGSRGNQNYN